MVQTVVALAQSARLLDRLLVLIAEVVVVAVARSNVPMATQQAQET
jgi:hypothetical protein